MKEKLTVVETFVLHCSTTTTTTMYFGKTLFSRTHAS